MSQSRQTRAMSHFASKALSLWTPDDVEAWLHSLSLGMLAPAFKHNGGESRPHTVLTPNAQRRHIINTLPGC